MNKNLSHVDLIRGAFRYQSRFLGCTMVFKIDFPVTETSGFSYLMKDIALLSKIGFKIVIVPGAKESIDAILKENNLASTFNKENIRITDSAAIPFVQMAAFQTGSRLMALLSGSRVDAVIGNFVRAKGLGIINGIDMMHTGTVDKIYIDSISRVLNLGMVPILPCIGWSPSGKPYNVPSDEIALEVSAALGAVKLFIVSAGDHFKNIVQLPESVETRENGSIIKLTPQEAESVISSVHSPELELALKASRAGVDRVHIIDGREEGAVLKELFSNLGVGTMVYADKYESIRALHSRDLPDVLRLMEPLMQSGILIRRTPEQILEKKDDYCVFEIDGSVYACGALHNWGGGQGEIAAVAADPMYSGMNLGRRIVGYLIEKAQKNNLTRVFILTTKTQDWFESLGFKETSLESLPEKKRQVYDHSRKSMVFALDTRTINLQ